MASSAQAKEFIRQIAPIIQKYVKEYGYKVASPIIAQACIESAFGQSKLASAYNNFFGMKCGSAWKGPSVNMQTKEEYTVGTLTSIRDNFRVYANMDEGVRGYFEFISVKRYANLKTATTPREYLERIKSDGYATSSSYIQTNLNTIMRFNLTKYDGEAIGQDKKPIIEEELRPVLRKGSKGEWVKILQGRLVVNGYKLAVDGIYGEKTRIAVLMYQEDKGLQVDGIVGKNTWAKLYNE